MLIMGGGYKNIAGFFGNKGREEGSLAVSDVSAKRFSRGLIFLGWIN